MPPKPDQHERDARYMAEAVRLAVRGHGGAEPNPLVGCVIVAHDDSVVGWGYHRRFGGPHAEIHALRRAGVRARGATAYVSLEPCNHTGKTPPCTQALINAGVKRVVIGRRDPNPVAAGGVEYLIASGVQVDVLHDQEGALALTDSFTHRVRSGLPWVIAKWAQTLDGRIATRAGQSKWISNERSRRYVHRLRGRVDAIITGIGTVLADDPLLTARHGHIRRIARRMVIDPDLRIPLKANILTSADLIPTIIVCDEQAIERKATHAAQLRDRGVLLLGLPRQEDGLPLNRALRHLVDEYMATNVLIEAGPRLLGGLFRHHLINEALVFVAPRLLGDDEAAGCVTGFEPAKIADGLELKIISSRQRAGDLVLRYSVTA